MSKLIVAFVIVMAGIANAQQYYPCTSHGECGPGYVCDLTVSTPGTCTPSCTAGLQCQTGECVEGRCTVPPPPNNDFNCGAWGASCPSHYSCFPDGSGCYCNPAIYGNLCLDNVQPEVPPQDIQRPPALFKSRYNDITVALMEFR